MKETFDNKKIAVISGHTSSLFWFRMDMMREFIRSGYEVVAFGQASANEWGEQFAARGIRYRQINVERNGMNPLHDLKTLRSIRQALLEEKPGKIFCYQAKTIIYTCFAAHKLGITEVYPLIAGLGSVFRSESLKGRAVRLVMSAEYKLALKHSKRVMFQNKDDLSAFADAKIVGREKCTIINGSGVDVERFSVQPLPKAPAFLMISRLIKDKGVMEYLEACKVIREKHPDVRCLLVGPFDTNPSALKPEELQAYIDCGAVEYFGEQSDVRPYIAQASVFVLPSYHEGTPKTVLESMACGRAILTTDAPGCRETVADGRNGYLVPTHNAGAVAEKMEQMIHAPELILQMGREGRKIAEEKYDVRKVNAAINSIMNL